MICKGEWHGTNECKWIWCKTASKNYLNVITNLIKCNKNEQDKKTNLGWNRIKIIISKLMITKNNTSRQIKIITKDSSWVEIVQS